MHSKIKTKVISSLISISLLAGGVTVMADAPQATAIALGETKTVTLYDALDSNWFSFTPSESGWYCFYSDSSNSEDPWAVLYDSEMRAISYSDDEWNGLNFAVNAALEGGKTYYLRARGSGSAPYEITATEGYELTCTGMECYSPYNPYNPGVYIRYTSGEYTVSVTPPDNGSTYYYNWSFEDYNDGITYNIPGNSEAENTATLPPNDILDCAWGDLYCEVSDGTDVFLAHFNVEPESGLEFADPDISEYMLVRPGEDFEISADYSITNTASFAAGDDAGCRFTSLYADRSRNWDNVLVRGTDGTYTVTGGVSGFSLLRYRAFATHSSFAVYNEIKKWIYVFVLGDSTDGTLTSGVAQHVSMTNPITIFQDYTDGTSDFTFQQIYSFTPETTGEANITVSNLVSGIPCVAVFDSGCNLIANSSTEECLDEGQWRTYGNSLYRVGDELALNIPQVSITTTLTGGETYYVAVPVVCHLADLGDYLNQGVNAEYDLTLTFTPEQQTNTPAPQNDTPAPQNDTPAPQNDTPAPQNDTPAPQNDTPAPQNDTPAPDAAPGYSVADFVERLYTVALGRASDPTGKAEWIAAVTERGETGADLARGFLYSPEFLNKDVSNTDFVKVLYRTFFNREADASGLEGWVAALEGGESKQDVIEGFINSTEWANLCLLYGIRGGGTGTPSIEVDPNSQTIEFATRLYTTCLGRHADPAGLMAWARQLANQRDTGTGAAHGFFFSDEFTGQNVSNGEFVTRLYRTFMNREPDEAGYTAWVGQLDSGVSREEVFNGFSQSTEFGRICANYGIIR